MPAPDIKPLLYWMEEREAIRIRKEFLEWGRDHPHETRPVPPGLPEAWGPSSHLPRKGDPWTLEQLTDDPILRGYRFCNVRREDDRVTRWIRQNIREPFKDHPHLWLMLCIARIINWPPTLAELIATPGAWPTDERLFSPEYLTAALQARKARGEKVYTGAYMIRAPSSPREPWYNWSKQRYIAEVVIGRLWEAREGWTERLLTSRSLEDTWEKLQNPYFVGWGPFMSYQVVVDMRHTRYLRFAHDVNVWAALGPGSRRGLNRLYGRTLEFPLTQEQGLEEMLEVRCLLLEAKKAGNVALWLKIPELSDVQSALCELDKYLRVKNGEGRPRALYVPGRGY